MEFSYEFDGNFILANVPNKKGVYMLFSESEEVLYIGRSKNLKSRLSEHFNGRSSNTKEHLHEIKWFKFDVIEIEEEISLIEKGLIEEHNPPLNLHFKPKPVGRTKFTYEIDEWIHDEIRIRSIREKRNVSDIVNEILKGAFSWKEK